jgi:hypothetical protein
MNVLEVLGVVALVISVIARQAAGEPIRARRLIILPGVLTLVGAVDLARRAVHPSDADLVLIAVGAAIAGTIGLAHGRLLRLEVRDGGL